VPDLDEALARLPANALGGRIRGEQFRMLGFQGLEPAQERVIFCVRDLRIIEDVVLVFVVAEFFAELLDLDHRIFHWPLIYNLTRNRSIP